MNRAPATSEPRSEFVEARGLRFHLLEWGDTRNPPLVMLHGLASTARMFDLVAARLQARFHIVATDQRGHGLSDKPDDGYDFESIAADLDGLATALGLNAAPFALAGHSWGAFTALYYAATRPQAVSRLALIDGGLRAYGEIYPEWPLAEAALAPPTYHNRSVADIERMIRQDWLGAFYRPELLPLALSIFDTTDPEDVKARLSRSNHLRIVRALWEFRPLDYFPRLTVPTLIVNAVAPGEERDPRLVAYTEAAERANPRVQTVWMSDTAHDIPWHRPDELASLLETFLSVDE